MLNSDKMFLEENVKEQKDQLKKCVPRFYSDLFKVL